MQYITQGIFVILNLNAYVSNSVKFICSEEIFNYDLIRQGLSRTVITYNLGKYLRVKSFNPAMYYSSNFCDIKSKRLRT